MEDAKSAMAHQQQQQQQQHLMLQQQHQQQQFLLLQQIQQQHKQQQAISRFPSNIDAHLRPLQRPIINNNNNNQQQQIQLQQIQQQQQQQNNNNPNPNNLLQNPNPNPNTNPNLMAMNSQRPVVNRMQNQGQGQGQGLAAGSPPANQAELQMAYQDAWRVCHPDFKRPFASLEDACERLLPYHVVADYEAEEDDRILDSDTTGQVLSRCQQWDQSIANKVAEFTATFEKQVLAFNIISRKRSLGEFRSEERLLIEQALLQEERRALFEARAEIETRQKAGREAHAANLRMAAMAQAEQARAEMMARAPIRASALGGSMGEQQEQEVNPDEMMNGWGSSNNNAQKDEKEPSEDFLNDEERENGDTGVQSDWREGGEFDLNTR